MDNKQHQSLWLPCITSKLLGHPVRAGKLSCFSAFIINSFCFTHIQYAGHRDRMKFYRCQRWFVSTCVRICVCKEVWNHENLFEVLKLVPALEGIDKINCTCGLWRLSICKAFYIIKLFIRGKMSRKESFKCFLILLRDCFIKVGEEEFEKWENDSSKHAR